MGDAICSTFQTKFVAYTPPRTGNNDPLVATSLQHTSVAPASAGTGAMVLATDTTDSGASRVLSQPLDSSTEGWEAHVSFLIQQTAGSDLDDKWFGVSLMDGSEEAFFLGVAPDMQTLGFRPYPDPDGQYAAWGGNASIVHDFQTTTLVYAQFSDSATAGKVDVRIWLDPADTLGAPAVEFLGVLPDFTADRIRVAGNTDQVTLDNLAFSASEALDLSATNSDNFDYPVGTVLVGEASGSGFSSGWTNAYGAGGCWCCPLCTRAKRLSLSFLPPRLAPSATHPNSHKAAEGCPIVVVKLDESLGLKEDQSLL